MNIENTTFDSYLLDKKHAQKRKLFMKKLQKILEEYGNII